MTNNDINDIIDTLNEGINLCVRLEKADLYKNLALSTESDLLQAKNMLQDLLNGK